MTAFCPSCGYNLEAEKPVTDDVWHYAPGWGMSHDGKPLPCAPQIHEMMGSIMQAKGRTVTKDILAERLGYTGDNPDGLVSSLLSHGRRACQRVGVLFPIETVCGAGVRWNKDAVPSVRVTRTS